MRDQLRRGLDKWEGRRERRDEEFADLINRNIDAMADRSTLKLYTYILIGVNLLYWAAVLIVPFEVYRAFKILEGVGDRITGVVIAAVFGTGLWLTYSLFRFKFPDLEDAAEETGVMAAFATQQHSYRKTHVWLAAVAGGVVNLLALIVAELLGLEYR